ncbi:MAG: MFS transporter [Solirubrobacteraceae bacterium]
MTTEIALHPSERRRHARRERERPPGHTLVLVMVALIAMPLSMTAVSVALPAIGASLHAGAAAQQGAITGYNVAFASLMLAFGSLGDLIGRRRLFTGGTALFAAGQLVAAVAPSILVLDGGRIAAGVGASAALPAGSALLAARFDGPDRAKAFGVFGTTLGAGLALGPFLGGVISDHLGWRAILVLLAILGAVASVLSPVLMEDSRDPDGERVDWAGTVTFTSALALLILAIVGAPDHGWLSTRTLVLGAVGLALLVAFVVVERRQTRPMLDLTLLAQPRFLGLGVACMAIVIAFVPLLVNLPTLFITLRGLDATGAGLILMFLTVPTFLVPIAAGALMQRVDVRSLVWTGLALEAVGVAAFTFAAPDGGLVGVALTLVIAGLGVGIANGVLDGAAISSVPAGRAGMAAGLFNTMRLGAETISIAVAGSLLLTWTGSSLGGDARVAAAGTDASDLAARTAQGELGSALGAAPTGPARDGLRTAAEHAYVGATHSTMWLLAAVCAAALAVTLVLLRGRRPVAGPAELPGEVLERDPRAVVSSEACSTTAA